MIWEWPPVDAEVQAAVGRQLHTGVSIYDRSGVIERFEDAFAVHHHTEGPLPYALLTSSGTAALHSAYYALGLGPGDEVLVQDYTFFATAMPLFQLGAVPVLCDVDACGNLDLTCAAGLITERTRALVVTHMWGDPQDTRTLRAWCDAHDLALVEDCSHAHGARRNGVSVGELADLACWSLQGRKTITAGEGGILTTPHRHFYERAVLLGHFNKRAITDVDNSSPLFRFAETGLGLKYRAHPLGLAMAEVYLQRLDSWLQIRRQYAAHLQELLSDWPGVALLTPVGNDRISTFYAFVFTVDPDESGFTRDQLLEETRARGCRSIDTCASMRPLHSYPIFSAPRSPVTTYRTSCIRAPLHSSSRLEATSLRLDIPSDTGAEARHYMVSTVDALKNALNDLTGTKLAP
jgi:perosamine synthetase